MPLFEYRCNDCQVTFDELVAHPDDPVTCPTCHSKNTSKLLSVFSASVSSGSGSSSLGASGLPSCAKPGCGAGGFS